MTEEKTELVAREEQKREEVRGILTGLIREAEKAHGVLVGALTEADEAWWKAVCAEVNVSPLPSELEGWEGPHSARGTAAGRLIRQWDTYRMQPPRLHLTHRVLGELRASLAALPRNDISEVERQHALLTHELHLRQVRNDYWDPVGMFASTLESVCGCVLLVRTPSEARGRFSELVRELREVAIGLKKDIEESELE